MCFCHFIFCRRTGGGPPPPEPPLCTILGWRPALLNWNARRTNALVARKAAHPPGRLWTLPPRPGTQSSKHPHVAGRALPQHMGRDVANALAAGSSPSHTDRSGHGLRRSSRNARSLPKLPCSKLPAVAHSQVSRPCGRSVRVHVGTQGLAPLDE